MADGDLTIYLRKLDQVLPDEDARKILREQLLIGDKLCCWRCGTPKDSSEFVGESIVCNRCIPELERRVQATQLVLGGGDFDTQLENLRQTSAPEFINEVDRGIARMKELNFSLSSDMVDHYVEMRGIGLSEEEQQTHIPDHKTAQRMSHTLMGMLAKRDEQLSTSNPYENINPEELLGDALQTVIEQMVVDTEFREKAVNALYQQLPDLIDMLTIAAGVDVVEVSV
jgi:hypothetical protein